MQRLLFFLGFVVLVAGGVYLLVVQEVPRPDEVESSAPTAKVMTMQEVTLRQQQGGRLAWTVWADRAQYNESTGNALLFGVRFELYGEGERVGAAARPPVQVQGESDRAAVQQRRERLVLVGNVHLATPEGTRIRTGRLVYDHVAGEVQIPGQFRLQQGETVHEGRALVYNLARGEIRFQGGRVYN